MVVTDDEEEEQRRQIYDTSSSDKDPKDSSHNETKDGSAMEDDKNKMYMTHRRKIMKEAEEKHWLKLNIAIKSDRRIPLTDTLQIASSKMMGLLCCVLCPVFVW